MTTRGCEVVYDACPTNYKYAIWWLTEAFGQMARSACPLGSVGMATRYCDEKDGWLEPDVSACTSTEFVTLAKEVSVALLWLPGCLFCGNWIIKKN